MQRKIETFSVVGGGSAYAPGLILSLLHHASSLSLKEVRLYDIHQENLETVGALAQRLAEASGGSFRVTTCRTLEDCLRGTQAVLNTTRPGGLECRRMDETLPLEFNIPGQETVGPGGFFFALRSVPQALGLAKQMEVFCPEAVLLNYTNPTNIVTQALCTNSSVTVVGLCDQSDEDMEALAESLGESGLRFECVGLNHATLYSQLRNSRGKSLDLSLAKVPPKAFDEEHKLRFRHCLALAHQAPGCWPNSYLAYYFFPQDFVRLSLEEGPRSQQIMNKMDSYYVHFKEESRKEKPQLRYHRGSAGFGDMAVRVLLALGGVQKQDLVLNLPNETSSSFLRGTILEAKSREFKALPMPEVPSSFQELLKRLERYQWAVAEACLNPSTQNLVRALSENPLIPSKETAEKMLLKAKQTYGSSLPQLQ